MAIQAWLLVGRDTGVELLMLIVVQRSEGIGIRWYSKGATQLVGDGFRTGHIRLAIVSDVI